MKTWQYLTDPMMGPMFWPGLITGLAVAAMGALLGVLVVLKRLSFIGQGVSHAAFGGMGIAAVAGLGAAAGSVGAAAAGQFGVVVAFCLAAALIIAWLSSNGPTSADTAIGLVLVASMALGAVLLHVASKIHPGAVVGWESILFGSLLGQSNADAAIACAACASVIGVLWAVRRPLVFWAFDETSAPAFGVRGGAMRAVLVTLLCVAIVTAMKVAGVVLATAVLVIPAAAALCVSERLARVMAMSVVLAVLGVALGAVVSIEMDWPVGPSVVGVLTLEYAICRGLRALRAGAVADAEVIQ